LYYNFTNIDATKIYLYADDAKLYNIVTSIQRINYVFKELLIDSRIGVTNDYLNSMLINVKLFLTASRTGPPGIPVLKTQNSPPPMKKFPKIPVR